MCVGAVVKDLNACKNAVSVMLRKAKFLSAIEMKRISVP